MKRYCHVFALKRKFEFSVFCFRNPVRTWRCDFFLWQMSISNLINLPSTSLSVSVFARSFWSNLWMKNAPTKCFYAFCFPCKTKNLFLQRQPFVIVLVARIRLLWILEVLIQLRRPEKTPPSLSFSLVLDISSPCKNPYAPAPFYHLSKCHGSMLLLCVSIY